MLRKVTRSDVESDIAAICMSSRFRSQSCTTSSTFDKITAPIEKHVDAVLARLRRHAFPIATFPHCTALVPWETWPCISILAVESFGQVLDKTLVSAFSWRPASAPIHKKMSETYLTKVNSSVTLCTFSNLMISRPKSGLAVRCVLVFFLFAPLSALPSPATRSALRSS
jgi:hypothetical protein